MSGFGAIIKAITRAIENVATAADRGLRAASPGARPNLRPILIPVENRRPRR